MKREQSRFTIEALAPLRIGGEDARQDLDPHIAPELRVVGAIDLAYSTCA
jgi:hypothetical protein